MKHKDIVGLNTMDTVATIAIDYNTIIDIVALNIAGTVAIDWYIHHKVIVNALATDNNDDENVNDILCLRAEVL